MKIIKMNIKRYKEIKWDEFDKELNKTFGTNPVIDFIKK